MGKGKKSRSQYPYIDETIVYTHRRKQISRFVLLACSAVVFGCLFGAGFYMVRLLIPRSSVLVEPETVSKEAGVSEAEKEVSDSLSGTEFLKQLKDILEPSILKVTAVYESTDQEEESEIYCGKTESFGIAVAESLDEYYILTDCSLAEEAWSVWVSIEETNIKAEFAARDEADGMVLLEVLKEDIPDGCRLSVVTFGDLSELSVGDSVAAFGRPYEKTGSSNFGTVTSITDENIYDEIAAEIGTDMRADIDSTGVLVDGDGCVVGWIIPSETDREERMITAYSAEKIRKMISFLIGGSGFPYLGITGEAVTEEMKDRYGMPDGLYLTGIDAAGPAAEAGLQRGDVLTMLDETEISGLDAIEAFLSEKEPGDTITAAVYRLAEDTYEEIQLDIEAEKR